MKYIDRVTKNLDGLEAVSTGPCPDCDECAALFGFVDEEDESGNVTKTAVELFNEAYESGDVADEGSFSWAGCGICDSTLGGDLHVWHGVSKTTGGILHFDDACVDCVMYLANGEVTDGDSEEDENEND